ncbi:hypothetical protein PLESTB_001766800 [Pleodorina starrii]|uniref:Protein-serine/threonine kinase n=1 Tax=Pleodorina starrii TaxID=330485 RepID=A0A9W6C0A8_9CHLO|nr:hypothetical protein PLESTM_001862000 [Pleodorina starrii]GLC61532.1 hypothetical protein PLESTB_001766800 [Pleodorina starrii]GLC76812.1 hypothetical protein PLESTF_001843800 [Pleodorina starrii]
MNVSQLGEAAGVILSAARSVSARPACALARRPYVQIPCLGLPAAASGCHQQSDTWHPVSGDVSPHPGDGPRAQAVSWLQQHHHTEATRQQPLQLDAAAAAPAAEPGSRPAAGHACWQPVGVRRSGLASRFAHKISPASSSGSALRSHDVSCRRDSNLATGPSSSAPLCSLTSAAVPPMLPKAASAAAAAPPLPPQWQPPRHLRVFPGFPLAGWGSARCNALAPGAAGTLSRRSYQVMTASLRAEIQAAALKKQTGVSLKYLLDFGTQPLDRQMLLSARFLHGEIPVRLAHRLMDLNNLPPKLSQEPHVRRVKGWYADSFADFRSFPPIKDNMDVLRFTAMLRAAVRRHNNVVPAIAKGVEEYKRELERTGESSQELESEIQHFLDTFFLSRIAIRFLAGHHISMFEPPRPDHIGLVHTRCSPYMIASDAVSAARAICFREYGGAPQVTVLGNTGLTMAYVPSHLHHMVFELVKNSLRAVQERYSEADSEAPPIQVVVAEGLEDVTIKVSDQGGGISRSGLRRIWTYLYTTARSPLPDVDIDSSNMPAVLAGYGCGLPLSRLYARYFSGDLQIISMEGYGTDAYLHLARLGNDEEPLPGAV